MLELIKSNSGVLNEYVRGKKQWECTDQDENTISIYCEPEDVEYLLNEQCDFYFTLTVNIKRSFYLEVERVLDVLIIKSGIDTMDLIHSKYNSNKILQEVRNILIYMEEIEIVDSADDEYDPYIDFKKKYKYCNNSISIMNEFVENYNEIIRQAEINLGAFEWKQEYYLNEKLFCKEVITPLLKRMNFLSVKFNHGVGEFGKDYIVSEQTPFGTIRYYGIQVKVGDIDGGVKSKIDEIIYQINDGFEMPFMDLNCNSNCYISSIVIVISGKFTSNAKQKIISKIPKRLGGSVIFIDKQDVENLIQRYWCKENGQNKLITSKNYLHTN
ncbi:hypothetical protein [Anaerosporobacter sp.]|uniref:hypothetical protein n=1 Tax=Anaerosporobacter sp. TaxID=1872529 RepID=UPI00286F4C79|nr:hypothetical protein [Anaerosporobacter sp.]